MMMKNSNSLTNFNNPGLSDERTIGSSSKKEQRLFSFISAKLSD